MLDGLLLKKLMRYSAQGAMVYLLFRYMPKKSLNSNDALLLAMTIVLGCVLLENMYLLYNKNNKTRYTKK